MSKLLLMSLLMLLAITSRSQNFRVVGNSRLAKVAGRLMGQQDRYAITFGKTIFVSCDKKDFLTERGWVKHEITHVEQYKKYGLLEFLKRYVAYSVFNRYDQNPLEKEALSAEDLGD